MPMVDFVEAVKQEMKLDSMRKELIDYIGSVMFVFTKEEIAKRLTDGINNLDIPSRLAEATDIVVKKIKEESSKVM